MAETLWDMSDRSIVRRSEGDGTQESFPPPHLTKVKQGEQMHFDAHVNVTQMPEGRHMKKATLFSNVPDAGTWEFISDEGTAVGGRGSAPSPLMYFAVGVGLCLMSHVEMLAGRSGLTLNAVRLEQRTRFSTTLDLGDVDPTKVTGKGEIVEINLIIDSPDPIEEVAAFVANCRRACMALQTVVNATPCTLGFIVNGTRHEIAA